MDEKEMFFLGYKVGNRIKNALPSLNVIICHFTLQSMFLSSSRTVVVIPSYFRISSSHSRTGQRCLSTWHCTFYMPYTLRRNISSNAEDHGFVRGTHHSRIPFWMADASFCSVYEHNTESLLLCWRYLPLFVITETDPPRLEKWHFWLVNEKENGRNSVRFPCLVFRVYWSCIEPVGSCVLYVHVFNSVK